VDLLRFELRTQRLKAACDIHFAIDPKMNMVGMFDQRIPLVNSQRTLLVPCMCFRTVGDEGIEPSGIPLREDRFTVCWGTMPRITQFYTFDLKMPFKRIENLEISISGWRPDVLPLALYPHYLITIPKHLPSGPRQWETNCLKLKRYTPPAFLFFFVLLLSIITYFPS
jgi:hypothetical protein